MAFDLGTDHPVDDYCDSWEKPKMNENSVYEKQRQKHIKYGRKLERAAILRRVRKAYKMSDAFDSGGLASHEVMRWIEDAVKDKLDD